MKRALVALLMLAACAHGDVAPTPAMEPEDVGAISGWGPRLEDWSAVRVAVQPAQLSPDTTMVGRLRFRGGLELNSEDPRFGGLSGLYVDGENALLAVSDQGNWFAARLVLDDDGDLIGLADPRLARMSGEDGQPLGDKSQSDAESLTRLPDGRFAVGFEQIHKVRLYDLAKRGPLAAPEMTLSPAGTERLDGNDSLEAMAALDNTLLIAAEGFRDARAPFWIAPLDGPPPQPAGRTRTQEGFGLVSLDRLPDGDFVAMERFFAPLIGVRIYLRRVTQSSIAAGQWDGEAFAELAPPLALDNFEGVAAVKREGGARLYIVSDDNFNRSQKTLLYAFDLAE